MENKFTNEQLKKARKCNSVEELIVLAKGNNIDLSEAEATNYFAQLNPENGELTDSELETVAGGGLCGEPCPLGGNHSWKDISYQEEYTIRECRYCHKQKKVKDQRYNSVGV